MPHADVLTTARAIIRSAAFKRGVPDVRAGLPPRLEEDDWYYEWGRQFAIIAPRNFALTNRNLPRAEELFDVIYFAGVFR